MPVLAASSNPARALCARSTHRSKNCAPIPSSASNDQTRARICEVGEYAPYARNLPSASTIFTVSPLPGLPSTRAIAPENNHGWRRRSDLSRPGLTTKTGVTVDTEMLAQRHAEKMPYSERHAAGDRAQHQHPRAGIKRAPTGEQGQCRTDAEERHAGNADDGGQRVAVGGDEVR